MDGPLILMSTPGSIDCQFITPRKKTVEFLNALHPMVNTTVFMSSSKVIELLLSSLEDCQL